MLRINPVFKKLGSFTVIFLLIFSLKIVTQAQNTNILRIAIPSIGTFIPDEVLRTFEAHYPDVQLQIINVDTSLLFPDPLAENPQDYSSSIRTLVEQADVILMNDNIAFGASISGTYLLDLSPIIIEDFDIIDNTMHPVSIEAFRDDSGSLWGIANNVGLNTILYDPTALDTANLNPPNENWTLLDYEQAAITLQASNGEVGMLLTPPGIFIRSLSLDPIVSATDAQPQIAQVGISTLLSDFQQLRDNNLVDINSSAQNTMPYSIQSGTITAILDEDNTLAVAPYPNNAVDFFAWGFGVSQASEQPILAYELALFLATETDLSALTSGLSLRSDDLDIVLEAYNPDTRALIETTLESPATLLERLYTLYLSQAVSENISSMDDLDRLQAEAMTLIDTLQNTSDMPVLLLPTAIPNPVPNAEQISLRFGVSSLLTNVNRQEWQRIIDEFVMQDNDVGEVLLISPQSLDARTLSQESDCFYTQFNYIPDTDLSIMLSLSPLIFADATFDPEDFIGSDLSSFERDGQVWALPMVITPMLLQVDRDRFTDANYPMPAFNWTPSEFEQSLRSIDETIANDNAPMQIFSSHFMDNGMTLLMLIAGYDGLPIDYRTTPPTLGFTSPENINAIRAVLNLAREGLIDYAPQIPQSIVSYPGPSDATPIIPVNFGRSSYGSYIGQGTDWVSFPQSRNYSPVSYNIGVASISSETTAPEACYRFIRTLIQNPHLFIGLPAYHSQINELDLSLTRGGDVFQEYIDVLRSDNMLEFPSILSFPNWVERAMLYLAFDRYVLEDAILEQELADAEIKALEFRACVANISASGQASLTELTNCLNDIDPDLAEVIFG
ncbi:MAG: hypothetical protein Phog2KO_37990 [Phototrophicaceae bacterium]